jgi:hypothetical protein
MNTLATGKALTVRELIGQLIYQDPDKKVCVFAEGNNYPCCIVQNLEKHGNDSYVELGGGWVPIDIDSIEN